MNTTTSLDFDTHKALTMAQSSTVNQRFFSEMSQGLGLQCGIQL